DEPFLDLLVEQVTHAVDEDHAWSRPLKWLGESLGSKRELKTHLIRVARDVPKSLRKRLRVAVCAARGNPRAAGNWIPGRLRPFNGALVAHRGPPSEHAFSTVTSTTLYCH